MPILLTINHDCIVLPDSVNVNTLLKAFEGAKRVKQDYHSIITRKDYRYTEDGPVEIEIKLITKSQVIPPPKLKQIPEQASPDCNGKEYFKP